MFDRTCLPEAVLEFVILTDTHHMTPPPDGRVEFPSRLRQSARAEAAMRAAASLETGLVLHLGDLVQEHPETPAFEGEVDRALAGMERCGLRCRVVPGNHDVGDKPDPTMPTRPVTPASLARFEERFGPSWSSFDRGGLHFVLLNSQVLNSALPGAAEQRAWLEADLAAHAGRRVCLFLHLPPYLGDPAEEGIGHYDNIAEPDRSWLLGLVRRHRVELLVAGHVHWRFFDRIGPTRYHVAPSTSFTRPGFSHLFTAAAPPEQGREDAPKLGFLLARLAQDRLDLHLVRTGGTERLPAPVETGRRRWLLTRTPAALPGSPLGVTLRHALAPGAEVPLAWPSVVRQPVRNDYPLLALVELGATSVRVPARDLADAVQGPRLRALREEGVSITAMSLWPGTAPGDLDACREGADAWELRVAGGEPVAEVLRLLLEARDRLGLPVAVSPVLPHEAVAGKQHHRTRHGYRPAELDALGAALSAGDAGVARAVCRIEPDRSPWETFALLAAREVPAAVGALDVLVELGSRDDAVNTRRAAEALFGAGLRPGTRVFLDPLIDLDRTMDASHGLLDGLCNPRPSFHAVRCLNSALFHRPRRLEWVPSPDAPALCLARDGGTRLGLVFPDAGAAELVALLGEATPPGAAVRLYWLEEGTVQETAAGDLGADGWPPDQAVLVEIAGGAA